MLASLDPAVIVAVVAAFSALGVAVVGYVTNRGSAEVVAVTESEKLRIDETRLLLEAHRVDLDRLQSDRTRDRERITVLEAEVTACRDAEARAAQERARTQVQIDDLSRSLGEAQRQIAQMKVVPDANGD